MRYAPRALVGGWLAAASFFVAACASTTRGLLTTQQAGTLNTTLDRISHTFNDHDCVTAQAEAETLRTRIAQLPRSVSPTVRNALSAGALTVEQYVVQDCVQPLFQPAPPPPGLTTTQSTPTPPTTQTTGTTTNPGATPPPNTGSKPKGKPKAH